MKLTKQMREGKNFLSQESGTIKTGKAIRGLAVGVLLLAGTGMYFGTIVGGDKDGHTSAETNQEINEPNGVITTGSEPFLKWQRSYFPGVDRLDDQIAVELEACEAYRTFLPDYVDEEGNPASSERTTAFPPGGWHDWYSHPAGLALPGIDRLDDQIAAGLEACEAYRPFLPNYVDEGNSASSEQQLMIAGSDNKLPFLGELGRDARATRMNLVAFFIWQLAAFNYRPSMKLNYQKRTVPNQ